MTEVYSNSCIELKNRLRIIQRLTDTSSRKLKLGQTELKTGCNFRVIRIDIISEAEAQGVTTGRITNRPTGNSTIETNGIEEERLIEGSFKVIGEQHTSIKIELVIKFSTNTSLQDIKRSFDPVCK